MSGVLVTGGTGSFGQAFVPALLKREDVKRIVVFSRDELKQAEMERRLRQRLTAADFDRLRFFLGDVRDRMRLEMAFKGVSHIVHAAALKRIEKCEYDPIEAVRTNIDGTANVIHAALRTSPFNVVGLSTDKACNPVNLYGATKLTMERLLIAANNLSGGGPRFSVVRYGNIFGSRGSVVRIWQDIAACGGDVIPISDPDVTRFFMRIEDAVKLVMDQLFSLEPVPLRLPPRLPAYRLGDLAEAMGLKTKLFGLSENEKLHEEMGDGSRSDYMRRLTIEELKEEVKRL